MQDPGVEAMGVERLAEGLWRWTAPHPGWREGVHWDRVVGSVYCEAPEGVLLADPLVPAEPGDRDRFWRALDRDVSRLGRPLHVLITCRPHARSAAEVAARYPEVRVWAPATTGEPFAGLVTDAVAPPGLIGGGAVGIHTGAPPPDDEVVYWIPGHRTLVAGDILEGDGAGGLRVRLPARLTRPPDRDTVLATLRGICDLDVGRILVGHGPPLTAGAGSALRRALGAAETA